MAVCFARIVMPRSRSWSIESMTRSTTSWFSRHTPDCWSMASTSVVLPWSTWAMIATFRTSSRLALLSLMGTGYLCKMATRQRVPEMMTRSRAPLGPDGRPAKPKDARGTFHRIVVIFRPYRALLALLAVTIVVTAGLGVVNPLLIKAVFDKALFGPNKICSGVPCPNLPLLYRLVALGLAIPIVTSFIGVGQTFLSNSLGLRLMRDLRDRLYTHLQSLSMRFFTSTRTGEIQSRLTNDVAGVQSIVTDTASSILSNVVIIISSFAAMAWLSWQLTVLSLILVPLFVFFTYRVGKSRRALQSVAQQSLADLTAITEETLSVSGILLAKVFGRQRYEIARFTEENQRFTDIQLRQRMTGRYFFALVSTFFSIMPALVYLVAGWVLLHHQTLTSALSAGTLVSFTTLQSRLFFPIGSMLQVTTDVQTSFALFDRVFEYLDMPLDIVDAPDARALPNESVRGAVAFRHVFFRYSEADPFVLEDINLTIEAGEFVTIMGPSGGGKTTLIKVMLGLLEPTSGEVLIDGVPLPSIGARVYREQVGAVMQEDQLLSGSIADNICFFDHAFEQQRMVECARLARIHDAIMAMPMTYNSLIGDMGSSLSGGQKQRVLLARALYRQPRILFLDEGTAHLDIENEKYINESLKHLDMTRVSVAHRPEISSGADHVLRVGQTQAAVQEIMEVVS